MINLQFNSLCPLCSSILTALHKKWYSHSCDTCKAELLYSDRDITDRLLYLMVASGFTTYGVNWFQKKLFITVKSDQFQLPIPDFNSKQELIDIANTIILFQ